MNKEFIPYEESLSLMRLGFDYEEYARYGERDGSVILCRKGMLCGGSFNSICTAPLYQQAFRWLRNKHNLTHQIFRDGGWYLMSIADISNEDNEAPEYNSIGAKDKYEDAELACLKRLIEIVKQK